VSDVDSGVPLLLSTVGSAKHSALILAPMAGIGNRSQSSSADATR
jgi:hypothetical protein